MLLVLGSMAALAQTVHGTTDTTKTGSITISNAARGEIYTIYKLFDATVGTGDAIAYKIPAGGIPEALQPYFAETSTGSGYLTATAAAKSGNDMSDGLKTALTTWAASAASTATAQSDGSALTFDQLDLGYYVVTTSQGNQAISVDSTQPNVTIYDKNTTTVTHSKTVNGESFSIGDTITYTATFTTPNYLGNGADAKIVTKIKVSDTLPEFLSNVQISSVKVIKGTDEYPLTGYTTFNADTSKQTTGFVDADANGAKDKCIFVPWADYDSTTDTWTSKYPNGSTLQIVYTAVLTDVTNINANDTNTITFQPYVDGKTHGDDDDDDEDDDDDDRPWDENWHDDKEIVTYAAALKKVDGEGAPLTGAKFKFYGLTVTETSAGVYTVVSYDPTKYDTTENATQSEANLGTEMEVGTDGILYIVGLKNGLTLHGIETEAPAGYNRLTTEVTVSPEVLEKQIYKESGTVKYDSKGNVIESTATATTTKTVEKNLSELNADTYKVVNNKGTELPSTGGIGTTIFYIAGSILVLAAVIFLVTKRRMGSSND
ncbi:MAG: LPXTG cell wall anchor domain-containing protein [Clostridia bacterium]|nr:LPXTG cell wall anchor domain-containing protein [Clostridia bacterium]